ncbi:MAG: hypothetical protein J5518_04850 [Lachnospiraceae bacterium]|nr:hypothetical protein [Lachnospiraceae bacterium]
MMIAPVSYISTLKDLDYPELVEKRKALQKRVEELEKLALADDRSDPAWQIMPNPSVQYQTTLDYLAELCTFMSERYAEIYEWS